jgi:FkbM family methyltransferase
MKVYQRLKKIIQKSLWPYGSVAAVLRGRLKGYKFIITENSGWSPILGRYEPECHEVFSYFIKSGQTVFDLGANNGIHSLLFSKLAGNAGKVYAFEPLPDNIQEIRKNCSLNGISNIEIIDAAVGSHNGSVEFYLGGLSKEGSIVTKASATGKTIEVKLMTLETFITTHAIMPDFIKIDIEGAESDALQGLGDIIKTIKAVFFIELHTPEQDRKVGDILSRLNFDLYQLSDHNDNQTGIPYLRKVTNPSLTYPIPGGVWGTIVAIPG